MDAVRLLPLLGFALWMVPLMWGVPEKGNAALPISSALKYIFGIWGIMVLAGWALWRYTRARLGEGPQDPPA